MDPVVIIGAGVAAASVARSLRSAGYEGQLVLVSNEAHLPYDRPPMSKQFLAGSVTDEEVQLFRDGELDTLDVTLLLDSTAQRVLPARRTVVLSGGREIGYSALVVATGSRARRLDLGRPALAGVHYLRTKDDAERLRPELRPGRRLVVLGGGFIGLEVAATAHAAGLEVVVLEAAAAPLTRVLGPTAGAAVEALHARRGTALRFGCVVDGFEGDDSVSGVLLRTEEGHEVVPTDVVVVGVGVEPCTDVLDESGVKVDDGVVCDSRGRTSVEGIYAAGDVSRWVNEFDGRHVRMEQWRAAVDQGDIVGRTVVADLEGHDPTVALSSVPYFWSDQYDHKIQFCGSASTVSLSRHTSTGEVWVFGSDQGRLVGVLAVDNPAAVARGRRLVAAGTSWVDAQEWLSAL